MHAGFPGVNTEFQELVKACAEAALETNDSKLKTKVRHKALLVASACISIDLACCFQTCTQVHERQGAHHSHVVSEME